MSELIDRPTKEELLADADSVQYAKAMQEFQEAPARDVRGWLIRRKHQALWTDSPQYQKAKRNSVLASSLAIFVTHTGFYPTKIAALGIDFPPLSKPVFLLFLLFLTWYLTAAMNALLRKHLIENAMAEIADKRLGRLREFTNRYSLFIDAMHSEKAFFDRRLPNLLCWYATAAILVSLLYMLIRWLI